MPRKDEYQSEYFAWANMKQRCLNPNHKSFADYGGRGITICKRWESFDLFLADMGPKPSPELTLERKNNNEGYSPENCVWATRRVQQNNMRRNHTLTHRGITRTVAEWARVTGLTEKTIHERLKRRWPKDCLFDAPRDTPTYLFMGQRKTLKEWCERFGILPGRVRARLHRGWSFERALTTKIKAVSRK